MIGEAWIYPRELTESEIRSDYLAKKQHYTPGAPGAARKSAGDG